MGSDLITGNHPCTSVTRIYTGMPRRGGGWDTLDAGMAVLVLVLPALNYAFYNMQIRKLEQDIERHLSWVERCTLIIPTLS